jgi:hypothetical protein
MGLLDDAIREHLELKRAHGADPNEVERQEREALGAPRQEAEFAATADAPPADDVAAVAPPGDDVAAVAASDALAPEEAPEPVAEPPAEEPWPEDEPDEVPPDDSLEHPPPTEAEAEGEAAEPESEDVLEETPDFLQETPEHDRLWFEQRPPRDFDWDK